MCVEKKRKSSVPEKLQPIIHVFQLFLVFENNFFFFFFFISVGSTTVYPVTLKIIVFCAGLMLGAVIRLPLLCRLLSKSSFILSGTIMFIAFGILGTFYHMQSLNLSLAAEYGWLQLVCIGVVAAYYSGGITQNVKLYQRALTSNRNRAAVSALTLALSWAVTAAISHKFNHAIWYIGAGWIYYNMAIVTFFLMVFALLLVPQVVKTAVGMELSEGSTELSVGSNHSATSQSDVSTDVTMDCVLIV